MFGAFHAVNMSSKELRCSYRCYAHVRALVIMVLNAFAETFVPSNEISRVQYQYLKMPINFYSTY